ncbi:MAG: phosphopantothenoylcysteine decarboxylase [Candidatus Omnitrophota bacterium]
MSLRGKRILITAGPTWVGIDSVRVISNIATGKTGLLLARQAAKQGARVTLVLGQCGQFNQGESIRIIPFCFFKQLKNILKRELQKAKCDIIIHSAAVSDFKPEYKISGKLSSHKAHTLKLLPLEKLTILIRRLQPKAKLVMFKLESNVENQTLIQRAKQAGEEFGADLIVANRLNPYRALIIDRQNNRISAKSKKDLVDKLIKILN